jgi:protein dithiol oxidoreductase (disulfide-forming)
MARELTLKAHPRRILAGLLLLLAGTCSSVYAQSAAPVAGRDYMEIPSGVPLNPADGKVVVEEFFNYICPACNAFEPQFAAWRAQLPSFVQLEYIPAAFRADFVQYARAYYAAKLLGVAEKSHEAVYQAVHDTHTLPAEGDRPDEEKIASFYAQFGVDAAEFLKTMRSFGVDVQVRRAMEHLQRCSVPGTPAIVVNGHYLVMGATRTDMLRIATYLIEKEHQPG